MHPRSYQELLDRCKAALATEPSHEPPFRFEISFADSYDALLSGSHADPTSDPAVVLHRARDRGRLLVAAEAGAGKSSVTSRILGYALDDGHPALLVDLRRWTPTIDEDWNRLRQSDARRMGLLLDRLTSASVTELGLSKLSADHNVVVAVDGLNEVPLAATKGVLWVLDAFAARCPWASILVCDRLQRRHLPSQHWALATITAVEDRTTTAGGGPNNALLLDITISRTPGPYNEAAILLEHVVEQAGLSNAELFHVAEAALAVYDEDQGRFFEHIGFARRVPKDVIERLRKGHMLFTDGDRSYFRHHLFHDALAAAALVRNSERWLAHWFDTLTFRANSFDALGLALESIEDPQTANEFLMAIYDWNLYGAAFSLSQGRRHCSVAVTNATELALLAVLAERRWDPVAPSVQRVEDALRVFPSSLAGQLLAATDLDEVVELVSSHAAEDPTSAGWLRIFRREATADELVGFLGAGPLFGWMASNALRRRELDEKTRDAVLRALSDGPPTVRWRASHTLGADATNASVTALLRVLDHDDWQWARYGAVRALVEIAAHDEDCRRRVFNELRGRIPALREQSLVFHELQKALELRNPPRGWAGDVAPLIEDLFVMSSSVMDQDHWRRVGKRISDSVRAARAAHVA